MLLLPRPFLAINKKTQSTQIEGNSLSNERLTGYKVVLKELVDPLWRHHQAPLPVLEIFLALVATLTCLFDHRLDLVGMERVEHLEEEVAFRKLIVVVGQVIPHVGPIPDLSVDILHRQPGPVRHGLGWHLRLSQALLLAVEDGLQEDQLAFGGLW